MANSEIDMKAKYVKAIKDEIKGIIKKECLIKSYEVSYKLKGLRRGMEIIEKYERRNAKAVNKEEPKEEPREDIAEQDAHTKAVLLNELNQAALNVRFDDGSIHRVIFYEDVVNTVENVIKEG